MSKFQNRIERGVVWLSRFTVFERLFAWMGEDVSRNQIIVLTCINTFNLLIFLTAVISPWIFVVWTLVVPTLLIRISPFAGFMNLITSVRDKKLSVGVFFVTVPFLLVHYICLFACFFMIFGTVVDGNGEVIHGVWLHFYFSAVTFTTLGYGNLVPGTTAAEVIAAIEAILGFAAFAFLIGVASSVAIRKNDDV